MSGTRAPRRRIHARIECACGYFSRHTRWKRRGAATVICASQGALGTHRDQLMSAPGPDLACRGGAAASADWSRVAPPPRQLQRRRVDEGLKAGGPPVISLQHNHTYSRPGGIRRSRRLDGAPAPRSAPAVRRRARRQPSAHAWRPCRWHAAIRARHRHPRRPRSNHETSRRRPRSSRSSAAPTRRTHPTCTRARRAPTEEPSFAYSPENSGAAGKLPRDRRAWPLRLHVDERQSHTRLRYLHHRRRRRRGVGSSRKAVTVPSLARMRISSPDPLMVGCPAFALVR